MGTACATSSVALVDYKGWSLCGAPWLQPVATGSKRDGAENGSLKRKPLPSVATSCLSRSHSLLGKPARQDGLSRLSSLQPRRRGDLRITWRARQVGRLMRLLPRRRNTDLTLRGFRRCQNAGHQACRQHSGAPARAPFLSMLSTWRLVFAYSHAVASRVTLSP
jgi:hypothetical protein